MRATPPDDGAIPCYHPEHGDKDLTTVRDKDGNEVVRCRACVEANAQGTLRTEPLE